MAGAALLYVHPCLPHDDSSLLPRGFRTTGLAAGPICSKRFTRKDHSNKHMQTHVRKNERMRAAAAAAAREEARLSLMGAEKAARRREVAVAARERARLSLAVAGADPLLV